MSNQQLEPPSPDSKIEKLLFKIIIQFSVYCQGLDKRLDPYLDRIHELLKSGCNFEKMQMELNALSSNLATLGNAGENNFAGRYAMLFDCLKQLTINPEIQKQLALIQTRAEHGEFQTEAALLNALTLVLSPETNRTTSADIQEPFNKEKFSKLLDLLVREIDIPPSYNFSVSLLKQRAQKSLNDSAFQVVINESIKLLKNIRQHAVKEQKGVESFLEAITGKLNQVGGQAVSVTESNQTAISNREILSASIKQHVETIKRSASSNEEITFLQQNINDQLTEIIDQLSDHVEGETLRQQETETKLMEMTQKIEEMEEETKILRSNLKLAHDKALHDPLTGLPNRLSYNDRVEEEYGRWKRYHNPLALMIWDIDHFKQINDNFGHKAGDRTLCLIAQLLRDNCRDPDFIARFGGEEFVMLLPNTSASQALKLANKLRNIIENSGFNSHRKAINITISCGISEFFGTDVHETVFERADKALYQAKLQGRNRCIQG